MGGNAQTAAILKKSHEVLDSANRFRNSAHAQAGDYSHAHAARKAESAAAPVVAPKSAESNVGQELAEKAKNVGDYARATQ